MDFIGVLAGVVMDGWPGWTDWTDGTGLTDWAGLDGKKHPGLMAILNTELHIIEVVRLFHQSISS